MERQNGDTWRKFLDDYLPPYLSRDPLAVAAMTLTAPTGSPGLAMIRDHTLILPETGLFDLTQYQLGTLATALQAQGWGAVVSPGIPATLAATALMDTGYSTFSPVPLQGIADNPILTVATAVLWQVMQPVAAQLDRHWNDLVDLVLGTLQGPWLDNLGTYLGVPRIGGEPDSLYQTRLYGLAITTSANNVAMETFFAALGYAVSVADTMPAQFTATVQWPLQPPQGFVYSQAQIASMIDLLKVVGVLASVVFDSQLQDTLTVSDSGVTTYAIVDSPALWGGSLGLSLGVVGIVGPPTNVFTAVAPQAPHL